MENQSCSQPILNQYKPLLIILMGSTYSDISAKYGDFSDWIQMSIGDIESVIIDAQKDSLPNPLYYSGVILSGSHEMVTETLTWNTKVSNWLKICEKFDVPIFGICYGHQLLAQTFGGWVDNNIKGLEIGTHQINLLPEAQLDPLFKNFPTKIDAQFVHYQSVIILPKQAVILASNTHDTHQAFRLGNKIWGVQFHPEFHQLAMQAYVEHFFTHNIDVIPLNVCVSKTDYAALLLERFSQFCTQSHDNGESKIAI